MAIHVHHFGGVPLIEIHGHMALTWVRIKPPGIWPTGLGFSFDFDNWPTGLGF